MVERRVLDKRHNRALPLRSDDALRLTCELFARGRGDDGRGEYEPLERA